MEIQLEKREERDDLEGDVVAEEDGHGDLQPVLPVDLKEAQMGVRVIVVQLHLNSPQR